jgi:DGQHR domain-containing protein
MTSNYSTLKAGASGLRLRGSLAVQNGVPMILGYLAAEPLTRSASVDTFNPDTGDGYQRVPQPSRIKQAGDYYAQGGRMPNPILANLREDDFENIKVIVAEDEKGYYDAIENKVNWIGVGEIVIPSSVSVWVYDGQHRNGAVDTLVQSRAEEFADFPVPVSLTLGLNEVEEMKEFFEVNNNAKSVKVDLAWELLRKMAEEDPDLAEMLEIKGQDWQTKGSDVIDALIASGGLWSDKIQRANVKKVRTDNLTLNSAQFIRSLQPVLGMPAFKKAEPKQIATVLDAYWDGIAQVLPEPFEASADPKKYVIQKGPGAIAFHRVLPQVVEVLRARSERLGDANAYARVLTDLPTLSGEIVTEEGISQIVTGSDFWKAGPEGVASQWTGDAGRKRLAVRIQQVIPRPSDDLNL